MPIKMKSLTKHRYGTRMMQAGDEYDVPGESAARVVEALKWSKRALVAAPAPVAPPAPTPAPAPAAPARAAKTTGRGRWASRFTEPTEPAEPVEPVEPVEPAADLAEQPKPDEA